MRRSSMILVMAMLVSQTSTGLSAEHMTGADLSGFCNANDELHKSVCKYYILGVTEGLSLGEEADEDKPHFCIPEKTSPTQIILIVQKTMRQAPEQLRLPAVTLVVSAMARAFPCPK
jgi:hypothetical protein